MTVAVSVKVDDGIVLAADSASTIGGQSIVNVYNNANKVFNLFKGCPIGAITWGAGNVGRSSTSTLMKDFRVGLEREEQLIRRGGEVGPGQFNPSNFTVENVAIRLFEFIVARYQPAFQRGETTAPLGFLVAGYSTDSDLAEEWQILFDDKGACQGPQLHRPREGFGAEAFGQPEAVQRLFWGLDAERVYASLQKLGFEPDKAFEVTSYLHRESEQLMVVPSMPIQDAIDLADFMVDLTARYCRFKPFQATVGGPTEIAAITKHENFKWIRRKHYYTMDLNRPITREEHS